MEKNIGRKDKVIRLILGIILLLLGIFMKNIFSFICIIIGVLLLITFFTGNCGLYKPLGINTNKPKKQNNQQ